MSERVTFLAVVGESFRQDALARLLAAHPDRACLIALVPEPENPADANAIKVVSDDGAMIGYLSRKNAEEFHEAAAALNALGMRYQATIYGGEPDKPSIGVSFDAKPMYDWQDRQDRKDERALAAKRARIAELKELRRALRTVTHERDEAQRALANAEAAGVVEPTPNQPVPPLAVPSRPPTPQPRPTVEPPAPAIPTSSRALIRMIVVAAILIAFALFALLR
jgi:hypothetical protein